MILEISHARGDYNCARMKSDTRDESPLGTRMRWLVTLEGTKPLTSSGFRRSN
ncbi:MAG: hypothetical protein HC902_09860 [Calothrix sp. SM1_5_4]|nr:hypothetical protein [Calothrix sp. SM1_5_4]